MSRSGSEAIVRIVNQVHPGHARYLEIDDMIHGFSLSEKFYEPLVPIVLKWMKEQLGTRTESRCGKSQLMPCWSLYWTLHES
jgi:hypothetical protein